MSSSEFVGWVDYFALHPFSDQLLDAEFSTVRAMIANMFTGNGDMSASDFSLLAHADDDSDESDKTDDELMTAGDGLFGGVRYVPADQ